jgi:hypothetical protein
MSADNWLEAVKTEEQRLLAEIVKTTLYKQLAAVRAVIAVYEDTSEASAAQLPTGVPASARTNGSAPRHSFKTANAFSDAPTVDASSRGSPQ